MCASFSWDADIAGLRLLISDLDLDPTIDTDVVDGQIFPFKNAYVVEARDKNPFLTIKRYSLTPSWSKDEKVKWATYNARMSRVNEKSKRQEKIYDVPTWKDAFAKRHCIVPISSFRESCREGAASGSIVDFHPIGHKTLLVAGIFEDWLNTKTGQIISTFAVITTEPSEYIKSVGHDRSPVFLDAASSRRWIEGFDNVHESYDFLVNNTLEPTLSYSEVRKLKV